MCSLITNLTLICLLSSIIIFERGAEMSEKIDRRQARTKQLLHKALMQLIDEKGIDGITVTDVANRADVNRGTFYLHYRDVPDMMDQIKEEVFSSIQRIVVQLDLKELSDYAFKDEPYPKFIQIFEEISRYADFLKVMFGPKGDISYPHKFRAFMASHIFNKLTYLQPQESKLLIPRDYLIAYMSSANVGIVIHWLESGMNYTPYEMSKIVTQIVNHGPIVSSGLRDKDLKPVIGLPINGS